LIWKLVGVAKKDKTEKKEIEKSKAEKKETKNKGITKLTPEMKSRLRTRFKDKLFDKENNFPMFNISHPKLLMDLLVDQVDRFIKIESAHKSNFNLDSKDE